MLLSTEHGFQVSPTAKYASDSWGVHPGHHDVFLVGFLVGACGEEYRPIHGKTIFPPLGAFVFLVSKRTFFFFLTLVVWMHMGGPGVTSSLYTCVMCYCVIIAPAYTSAGPWSLKQNGVTRQSSHRVAPTVHCALTPRW